MQWLLKYPKILLILVNLLLFIGIELLTRLLAANGVIAYHYYPTSKQRVLSDLSPHYGIWRHPDRSVKHRGACFDVKYETNSFGMRDKPRTFQAGRGERVVVLGDSFVEGYGVNSEVRLTDVAEEVSGVEMLNFGISGDFSSTQEYLLYRELASQFDHTAVALYFLPSNDFSDNNPAHFAQTRYRPYLRKKESGHYEVYYSTSFEDRKQQSPMSTFRRVRRELYNRVYLFNALRQFGDLFESSELKDTITDPFLSAMRYSYDDYSKEDLNKLTWAYDRIAQLAAPRPVHIFIIPREVDFILAKQSDRQLRLPSALRDFASQHPNVYVHDLLPYFQEYLQKHGLNEDAVFLPCDGHWSALGHAIAAQALLRVVKGLSA